MLTYADVCWISVTYADVCWCRCTRAGFISYVSAYVAYADVCRRMLVQVHQGGLHILKGGKELSHAHSKMNKNIKAAAICSAQIALILTDATLVL